MDAKNGRDAARRKVVAVRLRRFFAELTAQLAAGTAGIWSRVERGLIHKSPEIEARSSPDFQPQPVQQQQKKAEEEK